MTAEVRARALAVLHDEPQLRFGLRAEIDRRRRAQVGPRTRQHCAECGGAYDQQTYGCKHCSNRLSARRARQHGSSRVRRHGTRSRYQFGCRCEPCCAAERHYYVVLRARRREARTA